MGVDPIHFGIIMVVNLAIGFITPPLGINLFVAARVGNAQLGTVVKGIIPFVCIMIILLMIITYVPPVSIGIFSLFGSLAPRPTPTGVGLFSLPLFFESVIHGL